MEIIIGMKRNTNQTLLISSSKTDFIVSYSDLVSEALSQSQKRIGPPEHTVLTALVSGNINFNLSAVQTVRRINVVD
jgi:hypothetical protein